ELLRTFNCGIGMLLIVAPDRVDEVLAACEAAGQPGTPVGRVFSRAGADDPQVRILGDVG
ncbi:MAG TPA: AIR synthase-related protein, partial [Enhygromyxa sp.]|nr:AIR synthase-related protein [Enhygromyxa sp.]